MSQGRGHSRMKSDDYKLLLNSDGSPTFHLEQPSGNDPLENPLPVLLQPKFQCVSCVAVFFQPFVRRVRGGDWIKIFTNPVCSIIILFLALSIPAGLGIWAYLDNKPHIDMSLQSFEIPNHIASERNDAFSQALTATHKLELKHLGKRRKRSLFNSFPDAWPKAFPGLKTPVPTTKPVDPDEYRQKYARGTLDLVYLATGGEDENIFTKERLHTIHQVEQLIMKREGFTEFCWRWPVVRQDPFLNDRFNACTPPISLIDFFFPSNNKYFDGQGDQNLTDTSIQETITFLLSKGFTYWFVDDKFSETNKKSRFLRAQLKFGFPLRGFPVHGSGYQSSVQSDMKKNFIIGYIKTLQKVSTDKVQVLYGGAHIFDYEVESALQNDVRLVVYTLTIVAILLLVLTSFSLYLTLWGIISIGSSIPLALSVFLVVFKIKSLGILDAISLFVIIGIGVDDVFVFINTFRQARHARNLDERMRYTVITAAKATFFTSFTTAAAFAANCLSQMPAVHDFGLFMALIVSACWLTVVVTIPPALNIWYRYVAPCEAWVALKLTQLLPCLHNTGSSSLPESIVHFLSGNDNSEERQRESIPLQQIPGVLAAVQDHTQTTYDMDVYETPLQSSSDDEDLLQMPEEDQSTAPLLTTQNSPLVSVSERAENYAVSEGFNCGSKLQEILFHYAAVPILKCRYVILVLFVIILGTSLWLNTQIQTSEKPPQFFKKDTNLQQLLNLKFNMSADNYDCKICNDVINTGNDILTNQGSSNKPATAPPPPVHRPNTRGPPPTEGNGPDIEEIMTRKTTALTHQDPTTTASSTQKPTSKNKTVFTSIFQSTLLPTSAFVVHPSKQRTKRTTLKPATTPVLPATARKPTTHRRPSTQPKTGEPTTLGNGVIDNNNVKVIPTTNPALCATTADCKPIDKPIVASTAIVYVVFGVKGINRTGVADDHVIKSKGKAVLDEVFSSMITNKNTRSEVLNTLCKICKAFAANHELVKPGGADCFPYVDTIKQLAMGPHQDYKNSDCRDIPKPNFVVGASTRSELRWTRKDSNFTIIMAMAFESTTFMGKSSKLVYKDYMKWEQFLKEQLRGTSAAFDSAFQTSDEWVQMFTEIIAVNSAVYGIVFSLCLCVAAVVIFTGHFILALIVMLTILGVLSTVVAIFYLAGWQLGAVEAISLSILVGTSVDYCVHLVEGYILAGKALPNLPSNKERRWWRSSAAVAHIGSSILSSALTTIFAAVPLCFTTIQFFTKFGLIVAINTAMSIVYTFTVCIAMLAFMAPAKFRSSLRAFAMAFGGTAVFSGVALLTLYLISTKLISIPGPSGSPLFSGLTH